jgi:hypothetical protein
MNSKGGNDMKRIWIVFAVIAAVACLGFGVVAADEKKADKAGHDAKPATMYGELVDMGCYVGHGAAGEKHAECATKCIAGGMPMGLLTKEGNLYLLTMAHGNADPFNKLKELAGKQVKVSGPANERAGMKTLEVASAEAATPAAAPAK